MPKASVSSENVESFQNSLARKESQKWLISSDFLVDDALGASSRSWFCFAKARDPTSKIL